MLAVLINEHPVKVLVDSGASDNVLDERTYVALGRPKLEKCMVSMFAYGALAPLTTKGQFVGEVKVGARSCRANFVVVSGNGGCLISHQSSRELGLFQTDLFSCLEPCSIT
jgi:predicted aspartyl protease